MKISTAALLTVPLFSVGARADDSAPRTLVQVAVHSIFVPGGFDDNDEAQVILDGFLPSTCFSLADSVGTVNATTGVIDVVQYAWKSDGPCRPFRVPFSSEARLGVLPSAAFQVKALGAPPQTLTVTEALNGGPDDYLYAPIDSAQVAYDSDVGDYVATLSGRLTNSCMVWGEAKVLDQGKVIVVLPVLNTTDGTPCVEVETPFQQRVVLPGRLEDGRHVLHVRSLNGKAVNTTFSVGRF